MQDATIRQPVSGIYGGSIYVDVGAEVKVCPKHLYVDIAGESGPKIWAHLAWTDAGPTVVELKVVGAISSDWLRQLDLDALVQEAYRQRTQVITKLQQNH